MSLYSVPRFSEFTDCVCCKNPRLLVKSFIQDLELSFPSPQLSFLRSDSEYHQFLLKSLVHRNPKSNLLIRSKCGPSSSRRKDPVISDLSGTTSVSPRPSRLTRTVHHSSNSSSDTSRNLRSQYSSLKHTTCRLSDFQKYLSSPCYLRFKILLLPPSSDSRHILTPL